MHDGNVLRILGSICRAFEPNLQAFEKDCLGIDLGSELHPRVGLGSLNSQTTNIPLTGKAFRVEGVVAVRSDRLDAVLS